MDIESAVESLPFARAFRDEVASGLRGRATLILIPDTVSREMVKRVVLNRLDALNVTAREVSAPGVGDSPPVAVAGALGVTWRSPSAPRNAANLILCEGMPSVVYVHRVARRADWTEFIEDWARESRANPASPGLCVVAKLRDFDCAAPSVDSGVSVRWWRGAHSALEMRLACRATNREVGDDRCLSAWREHVIPALAAADAQLAERLWEDVCEPFDAVLECLREYARSCGWSSEWEGAVADAIAEIGGMDATGADRPPPESLRSLWASGGLAFTEERGAEIHPALLAICGRRDAIEFMLWRGQAELLLPMLNEIRMKACAEFAASFGEDWPTRWRQTNDAPNHLNAELGFIDDLFKFVGDGRGHSLNAARRLKPLVSLARGLRNKLAHNEIVPFTQFRALWDEREKAGL